MAGHSKFKNIMHRKGAQDAKRAKIFTKHIREITVAAKTGLPDPDMNPRLRAAIQAARGDNMPNDNIKRAIDKATGGGDGADFEEVRYEGYGPAGVALIVETLTDNRNRTAAEVRAAFNKFNGSLGETNSVAYNFERIGYILYQADVGDAEAMFEAALEAGAQDMESSDDGYEITTAPDDLAAVAAALEATFGEPSKQQLDWKPLNTISVDEDSASTLFKLIEMLDDSDDVQRIAGNFDVDDDVMERLSA